MHRHAILAIILMLTSQCQDRQTQPTNVRRGTNNNAQVDTQDNTDPGTDQSAIGSGDQTASDSQKNSSTSDASMNEQLDPLDDGLDESTLADQNTQNPATDNNSTPSTDSTTPGTNPGAGFDSQGYFDATIYPLFRQACISCHVGPRVAVDPRGPMTIYNYDNLIVWLLDGTTSWDNALIRKMVNLEAHSGGDRCGGSYDASPCKEVRDWFIGIMGEDATPAPPTISTGGAQGFGATSLTDWSGQILGYAFNPMDETEQVTVEFYTNAPFDQGGVLVGSTVASQSGFDGGVAGNHRFQFKIPDAQITSGAPLTVYMYAIVGNEKKELSDSPLNLTAYVPQAETYYLNNVQPQFNCGPCHATRTYVGAFTQLISPPPDQGGTATNNSLYQYVSGNKNGHPNRCGGGGPCTQIMNWWNEEFGN